MVLLERSFHYITIPGLQEIPLAILEKMDEQEMPQELVEECTKPQIYSQLPTSIKRCLWAKDHTLLMQELGPSLLECLQVPGLFGQVREMNPLKHTPLRRQKNEALQKLVLAIGKSPGLYMGVVKQLREFANQEAGRGLYREFSMLRVDLALALHDAGCGQACAQDPQRRLITALQSSLERANNEGEATADSSRGVTLPEARNLRTAWADVPVLAETSAYGSNTDVLEDRMVLQMPLLIYQTSRGLMEELFRVVEREGDPADEEGCKTLVSLLGIMLGQQEGPHREKPSTSSLMTILQKLTERMVEDELREGEEMEPEPIAQEWQEKFRQDPVVRQVTLQYVLTRVAKADHAGIADFIPLIVGLQQDPDGDDETPGFDFVQLEYEIGAFLFSIGGCISCQTQVPAALTEQILDELLMEFVDVMEAARLSVIAVLVSCAGEDTASPFATYLQKLVDAEVSSAEAPSVSSSLQLAYKQLLETREHAIIDEPALLAQLSEFANCQ